MPGCIPLGHTWKLVLVGLLITSSDAFNSIGTAGQPPRRRCTDLFYRESQHDMFEMNGTTTKKIKSSDFTQRMRSIANRQKKPTWRPDNMKTARSLQEYACVIEQARASKRIVVVKFHATWCKKCHSLRPAFSKMAALNPGTVFLDVPVTESNSNLHQGLGIESVPFGHVYHP